MPYLDIPEEKAESHRGRRRIRRLPSVLREEERFTHNYDPKIISFGPFHHGKPKLHLGQTFKHKVLHSFISSSAIDKDKSFFLDKIMAEIDEIRGCYDDQVSINEYDDAALAEMMLLDGCFIVRVMELHSDPEMLADVLYGVGMVGFSFASRDMFLLENQIPFIVLTVLIGLRYDAGKGEELLNNFLNFAAFQGHYSKPRNDVEAYCNGLGPPLHLLEAIRRKLVLPKTCNKSRRENEVCQLRTRLYTSRSVTDLKAKGVGFAPSPSACLRDVKFISDGIFYGKLKLPTRCISEQSKVLFANLIAYETLPDNVSDYAVSSYVNLMKSLVHCAGDVKELREKRVVISNLGSDEQVFRVLKEIETYGAENADIFDSVKERIEEHYESKAKTWMAELMHNYFESPWTAIALLAAVLLLVFTVLQTYFTIYPSHF